jgi:hypothetical protein
LIRHTAIEPAMAPGALPVAVIEPALGALLVPAVGGAALATTRLAATIEAAIALPSIAPTTEPEHGSAFGIETHPLPKNNLAVRSHPLCRRGFDNGADLWQLQF